MMKPFEYVHPDDYEKTFQIVQNAYKGQDYSHETTSIGIAIAPVKNFTKKSLLKSADIALYKAKQKGRNSYWINKTNEDWTN